jgi:signal recognition particle receptor subunit beta
VSAPSSHEDSPISVKIVISGGFGVDDRQLVPGKVTTTVALDFGRISLDDSLRLYLFGTPGQDRYSFLWDDLVKGALGAVVLLDTERIEDCFRSIDYFEEHQVPFLVAVNVFESASRFELDEVREALGIADAIPVLECDARHRQSVKEILVALTEEVLTRRLAEESRAVVRQ